MLQVIHGDLLRQMHWRINSMQDRVGNRVEAMCMWVGHWSGPTGNVRHPSRGNSRWIVSSYRLQRRSTWVRHRFIHCALCKDGRDWKFHLISYQSMLLCRCRALQATHYPILHELRLKMKKMTLNARKRSTITRIEFLRSFMVDLESIVHAVVERESVLIQIEILQMQHLRELGCGNSGFRWEDMSGIKLLWLLLRIVLRLGGISWECRML